MIDRQQTGAPVHTWDLAALDARPVQTRLHGSCVEHYMSYMSTTPEAPSMEATRLMREHKAGALPVVRDEQFVGVITERDFLDTASKILEEAFDEEEPEQAAEGGEAR